MSFIDGIPPELYEDFALYVRLEPRCRSKDFARGPEARTADPLWMLERQWQTGEFQGTITVLSDDPNKPKHRRKRVRTVPSNPRAKSLYYASGTARNGKW